MREGGQDGCAVDGESDGCCVGGKGGVYGGCERDADACYDRSGSAGERENYLVAHDTHMP